MGLNFLCCSFVGSYLFEFSRNRGVKPQLNSLQNSSPKRRLSALMFTDIVGYSSLSSRNETLALELLEEHRLVFRSVFPAYGGRENKTIGDAFFIEFGSVVEAVRCGIEI